MKLITVSISNPSVFEIDADLFARLAPRTPPLL